MAGTLQRPTSRIAFVLLLLPLSLTLAAPRAAAFDGAINKGKETSDPSRPVTTAAAPATNPLPSATQAAPSIAYAAFTGAMQPLPEGQFKGTLAQVGTWKRAVVNTPAAVPPATMPLPPRNPAVSTAPMTPGEKFKLFLKKSFLSLTPYALSTLGGIFGEATDKDHGRHMTAGDFLADSGTHFARSFTFRAVSNFYEKFAFATILRQDPRYHRSDKKTIGGKIVYAVTRVFITQGDRCGCDQVNASFLMGGLAASGTSQLWVREEDKGIGKVFTGWASHIGVRAFTNVLNEFIGGQ
jgi:hypothetical protein